jgi:hypothetical protein
MNLTVGFGALDTISRKCYRMVVAFVLNLFPRLGLYSSGREHNLRWPRFLGVALMATVLAMLPVVAILTHPEPLMNYHFSTSELLLAGTVVPIPGFLGADVEYRLGKLGSEEES